MSYARTAATTAPTAITWARPPGPASPGPSGVGDDRTIGSGQTSQRITTSDATW